MICPKCGFEQEERLDCKECGVIFSKYNALFQSSEESDSMNEENQGLNEVHELQIQVRELSSRLIEAEFEKAERKKLRSDLKDLSDQTQSDQIQLKTRLQKIEDNMESRFKESGPKISPEILEKLPQLEEIDQKTAELSDTLNSTIDQCTNLWEKTGQNSYQISELRTQVVFLREEVAEMKALLESLQKQQDTDEPTTIKDDDIKAIRKNLDELGQFISGLGRGYQV
jgi:chromosome segregation ATPase